jgi:hypothetical protein
MNAAGDYGTGLALENLPLPMDDLKLETLAKEVI